MHHDALELPDGQTLLLSNRRRRNAGVEPYQVSNRTAIIRTASRADRSHVLNQRKQIGSRRRRHRNSDRAEHGRQQRIQEEVSELLVVLRLTHAEAIFRAGTDDQFIDQRVPFPLHLLERARIEG